MRKNIQIFIMILAYALNLVHDFQPHEHESNHKIHTPNSGINFNYDSKHNHQHPYDSNSENNNEKEQKSNSLPHCHIIHSHSYTQLKNILINIITSEITNINDINYIFRPPLFLQLEIKQFENKNFYLSQIGKFLSLRAPPVI